MVYGVLKLALRPGAYDWQFLPTAGSTFADAGRGSCAGGSIAFAAAPPPPTVTTGLTANGQFQVKWAASPDIPTGATYGLYERSTSSSTWNLVEKGLTGTTYTYGSTNPHAEGTWVYRVQAAGGSSISDYSAASAPVVVDKSAPLAPLLKPDRTAEYPAGGWWRDQVTVSSLNSGDAVLADGTPGSGTDKSTLISPQTKTSSGTFTIADEVSDMAGWKSAVASIVVKVDNIAPSLTIKCGDVYQGRTYYALFAAKDDQSGLATPPYGGVIEPSAVKGKNRLTIEARDKVGHVTSRFCDYNVK